MPLIACEGGIIGILIYYGTNRPHVNEKQFWCTVQPNLDNMSFPYCIAVQISVIIRPLS